jgi:hypothetical protein
MAVGGLAKRVLAGMTSRESELARRKLVRQKGQILVIDHKRFGQILKEIFGGDINQKDIKAIWTGWSAYLDTQINNVKDVARKNELIKAEKTLKLKTNEKSFIIGSYNTIKRNKRGKGKLGAIVAKVLKLDYETNKDSETFKLLGGQGSRAGAQLGHEEDGRGLASSAVNALKAESLVARSSVEDTAAIDEAILKYKNTMKLRIDHNQVIDSKGNLKKGYIPILTWQKSISNQEAKEAEETAVRELNLALKDIATREGSTPLVSAIAQVTLAAVSPIKKRKNTRVTGKKKNKINEHTKGVATKKTTKTQKVPLVRDTGIDRKSVSKRKASRTNTAVSPFSYMAMINKKLPQTVQKNMGPPGLVNSSGRFASSVRLQDVNTTKQGHPSFGYTYAKNPYQVFEVGEGSTPWATPERDPRKLIDRSIREVAAELAIGRFYTRRL